MPRIVKVLISGRKGKLYDTVVRAFSPRRGFRPEVVPAGPRLLERAQSGSHAALMLVLGGERDLEPVRWLMQSNPALLVVAVLPQGSTKLRKELRGEGVSQIIEVGDAPEPELRQLLRERLQALLLKPRALLQSELPITTDLHTIRSTLTAIQGHAELALQTASAPHPQRKPLEEIVRGVTEVEGLLRRVERKLRPRWSADLK